MFFTNLYGEPLPLMAALAFNLVPVMEDEAASSAGSAGNTFSQP
jgi:hypothetical protein